MRLLVTGARGLLGAAIVREFSRDGDVREFDHRALDITDERAVSAALHEVRPDVLINCAAYNSVDLAQDEPEQALRVNGMSVLHMARAAAAAGAVLVHFSSDFVFDGEIDRPYVEEDQPHPRGTYAASKLLGEWFALEHSQNYVLRVESLFGEAAYSGTRRGSLGMMLDGLRRGDEIPVFVDRTVSPAYITDVAAATRQILAQKIAPGLYHCVNTGATTWKTIATEAARLIGVTPKLRPITLEAAALKAPRPRYSAMSTAKLARVGVVMPTWQDALARHVAAA